MTLRQPPARSRRTILPAKGLPAPWPEHRGGVLPGFPVTWPVSRKACRSPVSNRSALWRRLEWVLEHSGGEPENTQRMRFAADPLAALAYENRAVPLTQELVEALYGEPPSSARRGWRPLRPVPSAFSPAAVYASKSACPTGWTSGRWGRSVTAP